VRFEEDRGIGMFRVSATIAIAIAFSVISTKGEAAVDQKMSAFVLCKNEKNVRSIRILPDKDNNCTITYSKGTSEEVVGADRSLSNCKSILKNIQANLESSKWSCKSYQKAALTTSSEVSVQ
jgi:hypothetical protein